MSASAADVAVEESLLTHTGADVSGDVDVRGGDEKMRGEIGDVEAGGKFESSGSVDADVASALAAEKDGEAPAPKGAADAASLREDSVKPTIVSEGDDVGEDVDEEIDQSQSPFSRFRRAAGSADEPFGGSGFDDGANVAASYMSLEPSSDDLPSLRSPPKMFRRLNHRTGSISSPVANAAPSEIASTSVSMSVSMAASGVSSVLGTRFLDDSTKVGAAASTRIESSVVSKTEAVGAKGSSSASPGDVKEARDHELSAENLQRLDSSNDVNNESQDVGHAGGVSDEVNSLTSFMGSDVGERRVRLDEVRSMEALAEEDESDTDGDENDNNGAEEKMDSQVGDNDYLALPELDTAAGEQNASEMPKSPEISSAPRIASATTPQRSPVTSSWSPMPSYRQASPQPYAIGDTGGSTGRNLSPYQRTSPQPLEHQSPLQHTQQRGQESSSSLGGLLASPFRLITRGRSFDTTAATIVASNIETSQKQHALPTSPSKGAGASSIMRRHGGPGVAHPSTPRSSLRHSRSWDYRSTPRGRRSPAPPPASPGALRFTGPAAVRRAVSPQPLPTPQQPQLEQGHRGVRQQARHQQSRETTEHPKILLDRRRTRPGINGDELIHRPRPAAADEHSTSSGPTQQRVDLEREDALDLLSCLVERSLAFRKQSDEDEGAALNKDGSESISRSMKLSSDGKTVPGEYHSADADLVAAIDALRRISLEYSDIREKEGSNSIELSRPDHAARMRVVDGLLQSNTYAMEMKRAAMSASMWLRAIGRPGSSKHQQERKDHAQVVETNDDADLMDVVSLRARLHAAEQSAAEKATVAARLDEQLAQCREEIGRLRTAASRATASRAEIIFTSPDKSILDADDSEESSAASSNEDKDIDSLENALKDVSAIESPACVKKDITGGMNRELGEAVEARKEVILLKAALHKAGSKICTLQKQMQLASSGDDIGQDNAKNAIEHEVSESDQSQNEKPQNPRLTNEERVGTELKPTSDSPDRTDKHQSEDSTPPGCSSPDLLPQSKQQNDSLIADPVLAKELDNYTCAVREADKVEIERLQKLLEISEGKHAPIKGGNDSPGSADKRTINVRMLDGENFVTEWDEISPLPPPPDHGLRSPIVEALLSQWTSDDSMRNSLLTWMDRVMEGEEPLLVPPLKISGLDHRLRDGFAMHILPLLLRRSDVHVEVTSRAHRRTSYDIAVHITGAAPLGNGSVSYGTAGNSSGDSPRKTKGMAGTKLQQGTSRSAMHMMAYRVSRNGNVVEEEDDQDEIEHDTRLQEHVRSRVSDFLSPAQNRPAEAASAANSSTITSRTSNRVLTSGHSMQQPINREAAHQPVGKGASPDAIGANSSVFPSGMAVGSPAAGDEYSVESSITGGGSYRSNQAPWSNQQPNPHQQPGIMSALGGAMGGLFSRRKLDSASPRRTTLYDDDSLGNSPTVQGPVSRSSDPEDAMNKHQTSSQDRYNRPSPTSYEKEMSQQQPKTLNSTLPDAEEDQPYHRVVSAPPGRIGITFVQYRGHAMVSDVSPESPLSGWIFPSDIVIAIDEIPVSGLRVREIVKILTVRKERQRALRVISSHAMTELTNAPGVDVEK